MTDRSDRQPSDDSTHVADLVTGEQTVHVVLELIAALTARMLPNADGAGVTVSDDGQWRTAAHTDEFVTTIDEYQYSAAEGPCLSALKEGSIFHAVDLESEQRWPRFAQAASRQGITAVLSIPLASSGAPIGALNIYSRRAGGMSAEEQETAQLLAHEAALVLAGTESYASTVSATEHLRAALESREIIGQAKGIIMERERCSADEAFNTLRGLSQRLNRKMRDVAQGIVDSVDTTKD